MPAEDVPIVASDGRALAATRFAPRGEGPALVISPAMAVRRAFYAPFARAMADEGVATLTYDYRGIGGSREGPPRRDPATMRDWATKDMPAALAAAREAWPGRRLVMLGHSAGGWMSGLCPEAARLDGLVLIAAQHGHLRHWRPAQRPRLWLVWHVAIPAAATALGHVPGWMGLGQDVPGRAAREWAAWARKRGFVGEEADYARLRMPVLAVRIADDHGYAPEAAVEALLARFPQDRLMRRVISPDEVGKPIGHFDYFRAEVGGALWKEMAAAIRALPS